MNKKFRLTSCNICGSQAPSNFMVRAQKKVVATSRNTVGGKEIIGSFLGSKTSQNALKTSLLTSRKRTHMTYRTVWMCEDCSGQKSTGTLERENLGREKSSLLTEGNFLIKDSEYLANTKIPNELEALKILKKEYESKAKKLDAIMKEGFDNFKEVRTIYEDIKSKKALNFANDVLANKKILNEIDKFEHSKKKSSNKLSSRKKIEIENALKNLHNQIESETKKIGTRWENLKLKNSLESERKKLLSSLKLNSKKTKLEKSSRLSKALISRYKSREHLVEIFNEKHADIDFHQNKFFISRFSYKGGILEKNIFDKPKNNENFEAIFERWKKSKNLKNSTSTSSKLGYIKDKSLKKIKFWTWWLILFSWWPLIDMTYNFKTSSFIGYLVNPFFFIFLPILRILYLKNPENIYNQNLRLYSLKANSSFPGKTIHFNLSIILKNHLDACIEELNLRIEKNDESLNLEEFIEFNAVSSKANNELNKLTLDLESQESILSEDTLLLENINSRVSAINNTLEVLNSALS
tara:strand:+ start:435 stop:2003 length:1569 start_codon:yes stop_codon:yes gene_type:complete